MIPKVKPSPEDQLADDPGDDVARRFSYQWECGALLAVQLLKDNTPFVEIFCEHHEDLMLKTAAGTFRARQVKTRKLALGPFRMADPAIKGTLVRFCQHERDFPGRFESFSIATNAAFFDEAENLGSIPSVLLKAKAALAALPIKPLGKFRKLVDVLAKASGCTVETVLRTLAKVELNGELHTLGDGENQVARELATIPGMGDQLFKLTKMARALVDLVRTASSLPRQPVAGYVDVMPAPYDASTKATIAAKRIDRAAVEAAIAGITDDTPLLVASSNPSIMALPRGVRRLEIKMAAGAVPNQTILLAKDLKASADLHFQRLYHKMGGAEANATYQHARTAVKSEAIQAHDAVALPSAPYGAIMVPEVRKRLKDRGLADAHLFGLGEDILFGVAGILTEGCELWWSKEFNLEDQQ